MVWRIALIYRFAEYELDTARHELRQAGILSPLEPQVFHLLTYLIEHRYRVVSKQELLDHLWPENYISDATLHSRLRMVRRAIGDSGRTQNHIKTLHGQGYQFVAAVTTERWPTMPSELLETPPISSSSVDPDSQPTPVAKPLVARESELAQLHLSRLISPSAA